MELPQAENVWTRILHLFTAWRPTVEQAEEWRACILAVESTVVAGEAVRLMYAEAKFGEPRIEAFKRCLGVAMAKHPQHERPRYDNQAIGPWIVCVANEDHPARVGRAVAVTFKKGEWTPDQKRRAAADWQLEHARMYGGNWVMFEECSFAQASAAGKQARIDNRLPISPEFAGAAKGIIRRAGT